MNGCDHPRVRELAPTVLWCASCGAHRRLVEPGRWTRWCPAGVRRLKPLSRSERRQLQLDLAELVETFEDLERGEQLELAEVVPLPARRTDVVQPTASDADGGAIVLTFPSCKGSAKL